LIVDELGFVPIDRAGGESLDNLLANRYERRSAIVATNLALSDWVQIFGDEKLNTALLDRFGHHAHIFTTRGQSSRTGRVHPKPHRHSKKETRPSKHRRERPRLFPSGVP